MKRVHILERPMSVSDIDALEIDDYGTESSYQKAERVRLRKWRKIKHQSA